MRDGWICPRLYYSCSKEKDDKEKDDVEMKRNYVYPNYKVKPSVGSMVFLEETDDTVTIRIAKDSLLHYVKNSGSFNQYDDLPEDLKEKLIREHPPLIKKFNHPNKELQLLAVTRAKSTVPFEAIQHLADRDVQLAAVKQKYLCIRYIEDPDEEIQLAAIYQSKHAFKYIETLKGKARQAYRMMKEL